MGLKLWTVSATAEFLGVTEQRVYSMAREGILPAVVRLGRQIRVNPERLQEWAEAGGPHSQAAGAANHPRSPMVRKGERNHAKFRTDPWVRWSRSGRTPDNPVSGGNQV